MVRLGMRMVSMLVKEAPRNRDRREILAGRNLKTLNTLAVFLKRQI